MAHPPAAPTVALPTADQGQSAQGPAALFELKNPLRRTDAKPEYS